MIIGTDQEINNTAKSRDKKFSIIFEISI